MNLVSPGFLLVQLFFVIFYLLPIAVAIWAVITLHRIRATQLEMQKQIATIEQLLKAR